MRRYEVKKAGVHKFVEIARHGSTIEVRSGLVGTEGEPKQWSFATPEEASKQGTRFIRRKKRKGYVRVRPDAVTSEPVSSSGRIPAVPRALASSGSGDSTNMGSGVMTGVATLEPPQQAEVPDVSELVAEELLTVADLGTELPLQESDPIPQAPPPPPLPVEVEEELSIPVPSIPRFDDLEVPLNSRFPEPELVVEELSGVDLNEVPAQRLEDQDEEEGIEVDVLDPVAVLDEVAADDGAEAPFPADLFHYEDDVFREGLDEDGAPAGTPDLDLELDDVPQELLEESDHEEPLPAEVLEAVVPGLFDEPEHLALPPGEVLRPGHEEELLLSDEPEEEEGLAPGEPFEAAFEPREDHDHLFGGFGFTPAPPVGCLVEDEEDEGEPFEDEYLAEDEWLGEDELVEDEYLTGDVAEDELADEEWGEDERIEGQEEELPAQADSVDEPQIQPPDPLEEAAEQGRWLVEGYEYQGSERPVGVGEPTEWVKVPHEHFIPITLSRFMLALHHLPRAREADERFEDFIELVESLYHIQYHQILKQLKEDYEYFSPDTGETARQDVPESELIWRQRRFLNNFVKTMVRGNFTPFSQADYEASSEEDYLFDLPVEVNWKVHDPALIRDYVEHLDTVEGADLKAELGIEGSARPALGQADDFNDNVWVFYRGLEKDQTAGRFLSRKMDILVGRLLGWVVLPVQLVIEGYRWLRTPKGQRQHASDGTESIAAQHPRTSIFQTRWLRRVNLGNQRIGVTDLFKKMTLQEPALKRVVSLFRLQPNQKQGLLAKIPLIGRFFRRPVPRDWDIQIKLFNHIPLADSEMIFPEKIIKMRSFDLAMLAVTGISGVAALIKGLDGGQTVLMAIMGVLGAYMLKLISGYRRAKAAYQARVTRDLYHKNLDNNVGVLQYLVDCLEEQDVKEALLAYCILWQGGRPMTAQELDAEVEGFLQQQFDGIEVDFEVEDALSKVVEGPGPHPKHHAPLVRERVEDDGPTLYEAKPLEEALSAIDHKWDNFYTYA